MSNKLVITGPVDESLLESTLSTLTEFPIEEELDVYITCDGGDANYSMGIYDLLSQYNCTTIGLGLVASSAVPILLAGKKRLAGKNTLFLLHPIKYTVEHDMTKSMLVDYVRAHEHLRKIYLNIVLEKTSIPKRKFESLMNRESYFTSDDALKYGFIHKIL